MNSIRPLRLLVGLFGIFWSAGVATGQTATLTTPTTTFTASGGQVTLTATLTYPAAANKVAAVTVTNAGTGYTSAPTVTLSGGGGSGATATATVSDGTITAITVTNAGANYTDNPDVVISGGGGTGAAATAQATLPTALGWTIVVPTGWSLASVGGTNVPAVKPGAGATQQLDFAYFDFPANSAQFTVTLDYTAGLTGNQTITSSAQYRSPTTTLTPSNIVLASGASLAAVQAVASKSLTAGTAAVAFTPVTAANGTAPYGFGISPALPAGLAFNTTTGAITGTPTAASAAATYTVTITDANTAQATNTFSLTVNSAVVATQAIASRTLTVGVPIAFTPVTVSGGTAPYTYAVAPSLPSGLSLASATGVIAGTPTAASAATTYTITITDAAGAIASNTFSLTVNPPVVATQAVATKALTAGNGAASQFVPVTASGGTIPYTYSIAPALPTALVLNTATGGISGTPATAAAAATYTVTITDAVGATASNTFSLTINAGIVATQAIAAKTLALGAAATAFTPVTVSGGTAPYTHTVAPSLPSGLSLAAATGAITGTPTAASAAATYTITITDINGAQAANTFSLTVSGSAPSITTQPVSATKRVGESVTFTVVATGTPTLTYQWKKGGSNIGGATDASLTLNNLQTIDAASYTVVVSNGISPDATSNAAALTVNPALAFTLQPLDASVLTGGTATFTVAATGASPFTYKWYSAPTAEGTPVAMTDSAGKYAGTQTATLTISNAQAGDVAYYICVVTESGGAFLSSSAAQLSIVTRLVRVVNQTAAPGATVVVPVQLVASGVENTVSFSVNFDPAKLAYVTSTLGVDAVGATMQRNTTQKDSGSLAFLIGLESGQTYTAGTKTILTLTFTVNASAADGAVLALTFGDTPTVRKIVDANSAVLSGPFLDGNVTVIAGFEGDVNGDGTVDAVDWVKLGRIVVGLDPMPVAGPAFMKTDCAPRTTKGDGAVDATDWVQLGRLVVALDPTQTAGGPSGPTP